MKLRTCRQCGKEKNVSGFVTNLTKCKDCYFKESPFYKRKLRKKGKGTILYDGKMNCIGENSKRNKFVELSKEYF